MTTNNNQAYAGRWWIVGAVLIGAWVGTLSNSMMPVALPSMVKQYGVGLNLGVWVISVFMLLVAVLMPVFGWLGDRYGFHWLYSIGRIFICLFLHPLLPYVVSGDGRFITRSQTFSSISTSPCR